MHPKFKTSSQIVKLILNLIELLQAMAVVNPRFTKGELVWRRVVCSYSNCEVRNKLVLEIGDLAFDGYGIELLCKRINEAVKVNEVDNKKIYAIKLDNDIIKIQKICHNVRHLENEARNHKPLYYPRPSYAHLNEISLDKVSDFTYFIQMSEQVAIKGVFGSLYVQDPITNTIVKKEILDITIPSNGYRRMLVLDDCYLKEQLSRFLRGAIHGEVRCTHRLIRQNTQDTNAAPVYSTAKSMNLAVDNELHELVAIKTVRKSSLREDVHGAEKPMDEIRVSILGCCIYF